MALVATATTGLLPVDPVEAHPRRPKCETRNNNTYKKLLSCVRVGGVRHHQKALQQIADENGGNRADSTPGYEASVDYVYDWMKWYGWDVEVVPFEYPSSNVVLDQVTPVAASYASGAFTGSGEGIIAGGNVIGVDLALELPRASSSGCEPEDFDGLDFSGPADIALIQRGTCFFSEKAVNAQNAGAEAVVIFNQGNTPAREGLIVANASALPDGSPSNLTIPVVGASFADGEALAQEGSTANVEVVFFTQVSHNVIAELKGKNRDNVVMAGAHLDSVTAGPGIQDNGSGSAALLEVADQLGNHKPQNTIRFAWWGAEELGLIGSTEWVNQRTPEQLDEIAMYLNFDMIGSPNYFFGVYDADESSFEATAPIPEGSIHIEKTFETFYTWRDVPYDDSAFSGRSDYQAFINNDIPSSGLFTGAEVLKTDEQAAIWGGTAGEQFDQCYHQACDTYDNVSRRALGTNTDAMAFAVLTYAYSTEAVNGVPGKPVPGGVVLPDPAGPQGTFVSGGGGLDGD
ncbi:M28 family peptidase, partial [Ilumatobacter sp.]|uniref:M28 family peptidase n=1 Tax=Ilumatobacter sp. TaxID=1967498 RepID=UPI003AF711B6